MAKLGRPQGSTRREILEILKSMPGLTSSEIHALMPNTSLSGVTSMLSVLKSTGYVRVDGRKELGLRSNGLRKNAPIYVLNETPVPPPPKRAVKEPTEAALHFQIEGLQKQIADLQAWKQIAIARYPDLAVSELVLRARKLVAAELRESGDPALAEQIMTGSKDSTALMRVTLRALEESDG